MARDALVGHLYFLIHPSWPGYVGIGKTQQKLAQRLRQYNVGCPYRNYRFQHAVKVENVDDAEASAHKCLRRYRVGNTEWFKLRASEAHRLVSARFAADLPRRIALGRASPQKVRHR